MIIIKRGNPYVITAFTETSIVESRVEHANLRSRYIKITYQIPIITPIITFEETRIYVKLSINNDLTKCFPMIHCLKPSFDGFLSDIIYGDIEGIENLECFISLYLQTLGDVIIPLDTDNLLIESEIIHE